MRNRFHRDARRAASLLLRGVVTAAVCLGPLLLFPAVEEAGPAQSPAYTDPRLDPRLPLALTGDYGTARPDDLVHFVLEGHITEESIRSLGVRPVTRAGPITTAVGRLRQATDFLALPGVRQVSVSARVRPASDVSVPETHADVLWQSDGRSPPSYRGLTGEGVVVGIVDSGIDLDHPDFRTESGDTRVKYAWDQTWSGASPAGFGYGVEYTEAAINAGEAGDFRDVDGHGTHVAGIAAGNGRATGQGEPAYRFVGVAPRATLIVVKTNFTEAGIIDGVSYIFQKAEAMGLPAVVNLSVNTQRGGHDGSNSLDLAVSALTGPGRLVTAAVGNDGASAIHARVTLDEGSTGEVPFVLPEYAPSTVFPESMFLEGWHDPSAAFRIKLRSPTGIESNWIGPGETSGSVTTDDGTFRIDNGMVSNSKGAKLVGISLWRSGSAGNHPASGTWTLTLARDPVATTGLCHFWVVEWNLAGSTTPAFVNPDPDCTVTSPATGDDVIATGAYATKSRWKNAAGGTSTFGNVVLGAAADFSSAGPRRDGVVRPDVVAPGYGVAASVSSDAPSSAWSEVPDQVHGVRAGTSQANAHTTGALALLLEEGRAFGPADLTPAEARRTLIDRARTDVFTGADLPDPVYGYGKLALVEDPLTHVIEQPEPPPPASFSLRAPYPNPSASATTFRFTLGPDDVADPGAIPMLRIYDVKGRTVATISGTPVPGEQELVWSGEDSGGRPVADGVYFAHLAVGDRSAVRKILRIRR